ncbi:MAG: hypothetical protein KatS3mg015_2672 [Fimbriimonadales bacterium]|jgi:hypothetical protein|nr:MAG: hypothetical protein KatS3mg015_2672 [Fimbriimonadales bacterium]
MFEFIVGVAIGAVVWEKFGAQIKSWVATKWKQRN